MIATQPSAPSYLKYAFRDQHNLVLLLGAVCFSLAFASPWPVLAGGALEVFWLLVGPRLPAFRDWVDSELSQQYLARAETAIEGALKRLSAPEVTRFRELTEQASELASATRERLAVSEQRLSEYGLLELRRTFLDYSFLAQRVASLADPTPSEVIEQEAAQLQASYAAERQLTARMTLRNSLAEVQRRMTGKAALAGVERSIAARLDQLEKAVPRLRARLADPSLLRLAPEFDAVLAEIGSSEALELSVDEICDAQATGLVP